jgi:hypothetical protein
VFGGFHYALYMYAYTHIYTQIYIKYICIYIYCTHIHIHTHIERETEKRYTEEENISTLLTTQFHSSLRLNNIPLYINFLIPFISSGILTVSIDELL